ncbi:MAG: hypothetical protein ACTSVF_05350 [Candidatus Asgardarchaeia archaeon]
MEKISTFVYENYVWILLATFLTSLLLSQLGVSLAQDPIGGFGNPF